MGVDGVSVLFIFLTSLIFPICFILDIRVGGYSKLSCWYIICMLFIQYLVYTAFMTLDIFIFFFSFEGILIGVCFLIGLFGPNKRKVKAVFFFFCYSFILALCFLIALFFLSF